MASENPGEGLVVPGSWRFDYQYFAGETATKFFAELRDNARIMGRRCPSCHRLLVPARSFCDACYVATDDWQVVGNEGDLEAFTVLVAKFPGLPDPPLAVAFVTLDGADTAIAGFVRGLDLSDVDGAAELLLEVRRVRTIFAAEREGRITDFHFEPIDS